MLHQGNLGHSMWSLDMSARLARIAGSLGGSLAAGVSSSESVLATRLPELFRSARQASDACVGPGSVSDRLACLGINGVARQAWRGRQHAGGEGPMSLLALGGRAQLRSCSSAARPIPKHRASAAELGLYWVRRMGGDRMAHGAHSMAHGKQQHHPPHTHTHIAGSSSHRHGWRVICDGATVQDLLCGGSAPSRACARACGRRHIRACTRTRVHARTHSPHTRSITRVFAIVNQAM
jgi:hypothetical protein